MSALAFQARGPRDRVGLKGPRAPEWLAQRGIALPLAANTWTRSAAAGGAADALLVARVGTGEFFLEEGGGGSLLRGIAPALQSAPPGVYPVLREDRAFLLSGEGSADVLAQVCNMNFADLDLDSRPIVMTLMIGVAVLVLPEAEDAGRRYGIWCDPTFGSYLGDALGSVVIESGGSVGAANEE